MMTAGAAVACAAFLLLGFASPSPGAATPDHYRVRSGDTLWSIANRHYPGHDTRAAIYEIRQANKLDTSTITVGDWLVLP
jgi:nucleoid-associated protein YgaU